MARDVGTERIPVTGERHGADCETPVFCFQFKLRKVIPAFLFVWLGGIVASAARTNRVGVLVLKAPQMRDEDSVVLMRWKDWRDLHGAAPKGSRWTSEVDQFPDRCADGR